MLWCTPGQALLLITTLYTLVANLLGSQSIQTYSTMAMCNATINLDVTREYIGIIKYHHNSSDPQQIQDNIPEPCSVTVLTMPGYKMAVQVLNFRTRISPSNISKLCVTSVTIDTQSPRTIDTQDTELHVCEHNTTDGKEIARANEMLKFTFKTLGVSDISNVTSSYIVVDIHVLFYLYTLTFNGTCVDADMENCGGNVSDKCIHESYIGNATSYDLCQAFTEDDVTTPTTKRVSYLGVVVFVGTLVCMFLFIVMHNIFKKKHICRSCAIRCARACGDGSSDQYETRPARPEFTLDAPPPSYSDLSVLDGNACQICHSGDHNGPRGQTTSQMGEWVEGVNAAQTGSDVINVPGVTRNVSTGTLPPSYSDVVIHQEKYHVHT